MSTKYFLNGWAPPPAGYPTLTPRQRQAIETFDDDPQPRYTPVIPGPPDTETIEVVAQVGPARSQWIRQYLRGNLQADSNGLHKEAPMPPSIDWLSERLDLRPEWLMEIAASNAVRWFRW
jgi:hypothetical protein